MPQAISIDNFIDAHSTNPGIVLCGKLGIAQAMIEAERISRLFIDDSPGKIFDFNHSKMTDTWYLALFQLLTENINKEDAHAVFENISFVVVNYDRCLEHYLYHALQNYYSIGERDAQQIMAMLQISHPYGVVGSLPWQNASSVKFGGARINVTLLHIATEIRTFTDRMGDDAALAAIRHQIQEAETIVFLGFAFHELNMELLSPGKSNATRYIGTALGISDADVQTIEADIRRMFRTPSALLRINNKLTCRALFSEYWRSLSRAI
jgi:hypothetical protein